MPRKVDIAKKKTKKTKKKQSVRVHDYIYVHKVEKIGEMEIDRYRYREGERGKENVKERGCVG